MSRCNPYETRGADPGCDGHIWNVYGGRSLAAKSLLWSKWSVVWYWAVVVSDHLLSVLGLVDQRLGVVPVRSTL